MRKFLVFALTFALLISYIGVVIYGSGDEIIPEDRDDLQFADAPEINADAAVLMDATTGTVLFTKNASEPLPPASVTKIMTLLLVAEAIASGDITLSDKVVVSENASSMGGSQIFLKEGEEFTVEELLKSTVIASANDAAVALAECLAGSEDAFVKKMNKRAEELGMKNTNFENATGLDDTVTNHNVSAYDIAIMSRELIKHDVITKYSNVWQDSIRNGEFILTNTNRLVRFYDGCTGLKTGSTDKAGFCVSATAKRGDMHLIAVIMGAETRDERNNAARALLDYGFANYGLYYEAEGNLENVKVLYGVKNTVVVRAGNFAKIMSKEDKKKVEKFYTIPETLTAPINEGDIVGEIVYKVNDEVVGRCDIIANESVERLKLSTIFIRIVKTIIFGG